MSSDDSIHLLIRPIVEKTFKVLAYLGHAIKISILQGVLIFFVSRKLNSIHAVIDSIINRSKLLNFCWKVIYGLCPKNL